MWKFKFFSWKIDFESFLSRRKRELVRLTLEFSLTSDGFLFV